MNELHKNMMKKIKAFFLCLVYVVIIGGGVIQVGTTTAATTPPDVLQQLNAGSQKAGYGTTAQDPRIAVAKGIKIFLSILGTVFVVLTVYAGFLIFTAAGNEDQVSQAKRIILSATIGLAIILSAYSITNFIVSRILAETSGIT